MYFFRFCVRLTSAAAGIGGVVEFLESAGKKFDGVQELTAKLANWQ